MPTNFGGIPSDLEATPGYAFRRNAADDGWEYFETDFATPGHTHIESDITDLGAYKYTVGITTESSTSRTLALTDAWDYIRCTNSAITTITVPLNSSVAFDIGTEIHFRMVGAAGVIITGAVGVTINEPIGGATPSQNATVTLVKISTDEWDLIGP